MRLYVHLYCLREETLLLMLSPLEGLILAGKLETDIDGSLIWLMSRYDLLKNYESEHKSEEHHTPTYSTHIINRDRQVGSWWYILLYRAESIRFQKH